MPNPQNRPVETGIAPPPEPKPDETPTEAAAEEPTAGRKFLEFKPAVLLKGSHYLITKTQLVEGGVPPDQTFVQPKGEHEVEITEVSIGPATGYRVPADLFGKAALTRLLQEPDLSLVEG